MRLKRKCSTLITLLLILAGCVLRFAMPGHDYLGYLLWGIAVLVFLFPRLPRVGRAVLGVHNTDLTHDTHRPETD